MYSTKIESRIIDPVYHSNQRTEFKLGSSDDEVYLSSIQISNLGAYGPALGTDENRYNASAGVLGLINKITL